MKKTFLQKLAVLVIICLNFQILIANPVFAQGAGMFAPFLQQNKNRTEGGGDSFHSRDNPDSLGNGVDTQFKKGQLEGLGASSAGTNNSIPVIYQINVTGEVMNSGTYRIPASTRLSEILNMAGGVAKSGSQRQVQIRSIRGGIKTVDLLQYKQKGELAQNPYLLDNDTVYIPLKKETIEIEGAVNRPGIYELRNEKSLQTVIDLAGGYSQGVSRQQSIRIIRFSVEDQKEVLEIPNTPADLSSTLIKNADVIVVPHILTAKNTFDYNIKKLPNDNIFYPSYEDRVFVIGAVNTPGTFDFNHNYRLSNYLAMAGGLSRMAKGGGYVKIIDGQGQSKKVKSDSQEIINPGDTLYVPERTLSRETWVGIVTSLVGIAFTTANLAVTLSR